MRHKLLLVTNTNNQPFNRAILDFIPLTEFEPFVVDDQGYMNKPENWRRRLGIKMAQLVLSWIPKSAPMSLLAKLSEYIYLRLIDDLRNIQPAVVITDNYLVSLAVSNFIEHGLYRGRLVFYSRALAIDWVKPAKNVSVFAAVTLAQSQSFQVLGVPESKIVRTGPFVPTEFFGAQKTATDENRLMLGLMSTFSRVMVLMDHNNLPASIEIVKQLFRSQVSFQVLLVGDAGQLKNKLPSAPAHHPLKIFSVDNFVQLCGHANVLVCSPNLQLVAAGLAVPMPVVVDGSQESAELVELQKLRVTEVGRNAREIQFQVEQILARSKPGQWQHAKLQLWPQGCPDTAKMLGLVRPEASTPTIKNYQKS